MQRTSDLLYLTMITDSSDEAVSLSEYLNQHGVLAQKDGANEVVCPMTDPAIAAVAHNLRRTWRLFWENSDGMLPFPIYIKNPS